MVDEAQIREAFDTRIRRDFIEAGGDVLSMGSGDIAALVYRTSRREDVTQAVLASLARDPLKVVRLLELAVRIDPDGDGRGGPRVRFDEVRTLDDHVDLEAVAKAISTTPMDAWERRGERGMVEHVRKYIEKKAGDSASDSSPESSDMG